MLYEYQYVWSLFLIIVICVIIISQFLEQQVAQLSASEASSSQVYTIWVGAGMWWGMCILWWDMCICVLKIYMSCNRVQKFICTAYQWRRTRWSHSTAKLLFTFSPCFREQYITWYSILYTDICWSLLLYI